MRLRVLLPALALLLLAGLPLANHLRTPRPASAPSPAFTAPTFSPAPTHSPAVAQPTSQSLIDQTSAPHATDASSPSPAITSAQVSGLTPRLAPTLATLPPGPFLDSLVALTPADRAAALAHLATLDVPADQYTTLRATPLGGLYHVCPPGPHAPHPGHHAATLTSALPDTSTAPSSTSASSPPSAPGSPLQAPVPIANPPALSSRPGATRVLYLDFNGHTVTGTAWNRGTGSQARYDALPYDTDGNLTTFSDAEQTVIREVWARVSEDFAPFDINVTTVQPSSFTPTTGRVVITLAVDANENFVPGGEGSGGVAYLGVFGEANYVSNFSPAWAIADNVGETNAANIAEVVSHEFGHNLGLNHDGTSTLEYYRGHGSGATSWGPIMGASYGRQITTFSKGEYTGANNTREDDLAIIAALLPYRPDDAPATITGAPVLGGAGTTRTGLIERNTDADTYRFTNGGGRIIISVNAFTAASGPRGNNLDIAADLLNAAGNVVATFEPAATPDITINAAHPIGTYHLRVRSSAVGNPTASPPTGYTAYASLGAYTILNNTNTVPPPDITTQPIGAARPLGSSHTFTLVADSTATSYQWSFNGTPISGATSPSLTLNSLTYARAGTYTCTVANPSTGIVSQPAVLAIYNATPQTYTINPEANATFPQLVAGAFDDYVWTRDATTLVPDTDPRLIISGPTLRISGTRASDAAVYTLSATFQGNPVPIGPVTLILRPPVLLSVPPVVNVFRGENPQFTITSSHESLVYRYFGLPLGLGFDPATGALFSGTPAPAPGTYPLRLRGTDPFGNRGHVNFDLVISTRTLAVSTPPTLAAYPGVAPLLAVTADVPTYTYRYFGLPPGLGFNPATGALLPRTPPAAPGTYPVTLTLTDPFGNTGSTTFDLVVSPLPADGLAPLAGIVPRDPALNQNLGGTFTLTPVLSRGLPTGAYTGTLTLGTTRYVLTGRLATGSPGTDLTLSATAAAKGRPALTLALTLPADGVSPITGQLQPASSPPLALSAWPTPYSTKNRPVPFLGKHTFALFLQEPPAPPAAPAGTGFGTLTIATSGRATWTARLPDGTAPTGSAALARDGQIPLLALLPASSGSLHGTLALSPEDRSVDGTLTWLRLPAPPKTYAKALLYRDGFGPLTLNALGGPLNPPATGTRVLGLADTSPNATLSFLGGGLTETHLAQLALPPITVSVKNLAPLPTAAAANPAALTLRIAPATGTFSGTFTLKDPNPLKPAATLSRKVAYQGVLLGGRGVGFYLVPGIRQTLTDAPPTLSGAILLEPTPAE